MLAFLVIVAGGLLVAGLVALLHAARQAPPGWEDSQGFHESPDRPLSPRRAEAGRVAAPAHAIPHDCLAP